MTSTIREFDAHIYFTEDSKDTAAELRQKMLTQFGGSKLRIGGLVNRPVGPHPLPMFEVNFRKEDWAEVNSWLEKERGPHVVLIHPVTENDLLDHTTHAKWLGKPLGLDLTKL